MKWTMVEFNKILKKSMTDVKLLEKTHPKESVGLWVKICKDIIEFTKSPNCPRNLRPKLLTQAESIVIKVKHMKEGHLNSVFGSIPKNKSEHISSSVNLVNLQSQSNNDEKNNEIEEQEMLSKLNSLPDIPIKEIHTSENFTPNNPNNIILEPQDDKQDDNINTKLPLDPNNSDHIASAYKKEVTFEDIKSLEEELKKLPSNMKEIAPTPFSNNDIMINKNISKMDLDSFKTETTFLDLTLSGDENTAASGIENSFKHKNSSDNVKINGFIKDPFVAVQQNLEEKKVVDPFGPDGLDNSQKEINIDNSESPQKMCFACGCSLKPEESFCPECGTKN